MKKQLTIVVLLFVTSFVFAQDYSQFKEYSYTEFFQLIKNEQDSIFKLSDAVVIYNQKVDTTFSFFNDFENYSKSFKRTDSIVVDKELQLNNVHFILTRKNFIVGMLSNVIFKRKLHFLDSQIPGFQNSDFYETVNIEITNDFNKYLEQLRTQYKDGFFNDLSINYNQCNFYKGINYYNGSIDETNIQFGITFSHLWPRNERVHCTFTYQNQFNFWLTANTFHGEGQLWISPIKGRMLDIDRNNFEKNIVVRLSLNEADITRMNISKNNFQGIILADFNQFDNNDNISWLQFSNKLIAHDAYQQYYFVNLYLGLDSIADFTPSKEGYSKLNIDFYLNRARIENAEVHHAEKKLRSVFYNHFKQNQNTDFSNAVYLEMKDLETERLQYLNNTKPSFNTFFTFKINQFLKVFSAYGTEPARAIIFSIYVILSFAFIYLFFPNSWDKHGKNRIINRYRFFTKYMNKNTGINEVYLEDKKEDLLEYDEFKNYMESSVKTIPKFFSATALPLYKWAVSGTKLSASVLKRVDIMKGTWSDLPAHKRFWKSILLIGAFLIAVLYDISIKMLNALMLSINTFTTLGFGEIPMKGLPRYLAIIQGFIGWFMLTIFSVSLISQLLN